MKNILVTGASGFIGSHLCMALLEAGYKVVAVDNLCNSRREVIAKLPQINPKAKDGLVFYETDLLRQEEVARCFSEHAIDAVIHLAALKAVAESMNEPLRYYHNNVGGLINLLQVMEQAGCAKMVYSSSATVYGLPQQLPIAESHPLSAVNPYGGSKIIGENILKDLAAGSERSGGGKHSIISLRYFNPAGAHKSGIIGEEFGERPANLFPALCKAYLDSEYQLQVFGADYDTKDGSCIRDIIHINDLVEGHIVALRKVLAKELGYEAVNLGCGAGWTVLEIIKEFEAALGSRLNYKIAPRRAGDVVASYASVSYAKEFLGWEAQHTLPEICRDTVNFIRKNYQ